MRPLTKEARLNSRNAQIEFDLSRGGQKFEDESLGAVWTLYPYQHPTYGPRVSARGWVGNSCNTAFHHSFSDDRRAAIFINSWLNGVRQTAERRAQRVAEERAARSSKSAADFFTVGDVLYTMWGYDQTNVEWFQVTQVKGWRIHVRAIAANCSDNGGPYGGKTAPRRNDWVGEEKCCPVRPSGSVLSPTYKHHMRKWEGRALGCSSYA